MTNNQYHNNWTTEQNDTLCDNWEYFINNKNIAELTLGHSWESIRKHAHIFGKQTIPNNISCPQYLGIHVAERILANIFENVERMPFGTSGYDYICKRGYKIDVKSACLNHYNKWLFNINRNNIADYFLLLAFNNRDDLEPQKLWLINSSEIINTTHGNQMINEKKSFRITNKETYLKRYTKYEQIDKLEKLINCCNTLR